MVIIKQTVTDDIEFIEACLKEKDEKFAEQCGYGSRFFDYPITYEQILKFQEDVHPDSIFFTVFFNETKIGSLELIQKPVEKSCTIARFLIADNFRFKGYGSEALLKVVEYSFNTLHYSKINLCVFDFNKSAQKCYTNAGFKFVRDEIRPDGYTAIYMEIINPIV